MTDVEYLKAVFANAKEKTEDEDLLIELDGAISFLYSLTDTPQIILNS